MSTEFQSTNCPRCNMLLPAPSCGPDHVDESQATATARPWAAEGRFITANDRIIAEILLLPEPLLPQKANAALIVQAVNSFDVLRDALAYAIVNAVANGADWSRDIREWAEKHHEPQRHLNKSGGDIVRAALKLTEEYDIDAERVTFQEQLGKAMVKAGAKEITLD